MSTEDLFNNAFNSLEEKRIAEGKEAAAKAVTAAEKAAAAAEEMKKAQLDQLERDARKYNAARTMLRDIFSTVANDLNNIPAIRARNLQFSMTLEDKFTGASIYDNNEDGWGHVDYCTIGIDCADGNNKTATIIRFNVADYWNGLLASPTDVTDKETWKTKDSDLRKPEGQDQLKKTLVKNAAAYIHNLG